MKRLLLALALIVPLPGTALAIQEGKQFLELPFPQPVETGAKIEVREFFWYGCPHCYTLEPALNQWVKKLPGGVQLVRTPGMAPRWVVHAQTFYALETLNALDKVHGPLFHAIHEERQPLNDEASITDFVVRHGVDREQFRSAFRSFGVRMKLERAKQLNADFVVSSVPMFAVDGKYVTSQTMAGGSEQALFQVLDQLIARARRERAQKSAR
jgi:thiol:disulfide interchange protein DsbA